MLEVALSESLPRSCIHCVVSRGSLYDSRASRELKISLTGLIGASATFAKEVLAALRRQEKHQYPSANEEEQRIVELHACENVKVRYNHQRLQGDRS